MSWAAIALLSSIMASAAEQSPIHWIITAKGDKVNQAMADRLHDEACRWVEEQFSPSGKPVRPNLTIHVGEACPDGTISHACLSARPGDLYLPHWDADAPGTVVHATIVVAMVNLAEQQDIPDVIKTLLTEDERDFLDARGRVPEARQKAERLKQ